MSQCELSFFETDNPLASKLYHKLIEDGVTCRELDQEVSDGFLTAAEVIGYAFERYEKYYETIEGTQGGKKSMLGFDILRNNAELREETRRIKSANKNPWQLSKKLFTLVYGTLGKDWPEKYKREVLFAVFKMAGLSPAFLLPNLDTILKEWPKTGKQSSIFVGFVSISKREFYYLNLQEALLFRKDSIPIVLTLPQYTSLELAHEAMASIEHGKREEAIFRLSEAIRMGPNLPWLYYLRGIVWQDNNEKYNTPPDYDRAIADFSKVIGDIKKHPYLKKAYYYRAFARRQKGKIDLALQDLSNCEKDPQAYALKGELWMEKREWNTAIASFNEALKLDKGNPVYLYHLGRCHHEKGDLEKAVSYYMQALKGADQKLQATLYFQGGLLRREQGNLSRAKENFLKSIQFNPDNQEAHFQLGLSNLDLELPKEALEAFAKGIENGREPEKLLEPLSKYRKNWWTSEGRHNETQKKFKRETGLEIAEIETQILYAFSLWLIQGGTYRKKAKELLGLVSNWVGRSRDQEEVKIFLDNMSKLIPEDMKREPEIVDLFYSKESQIKPSKDTLLPHFTCLYHQSLSISPAPVYFSLGGNAGGGELLFKMGWVLLDPHTHLTLGVGGEFTGFTDELRTERPYRQAVDEGFTKLTIKNSASYTAKVRLEAEPVFFKAETLSLGAFLEAAYTVMSGSVIMYSGTSNTTGDYDVQSFRSRLGLMAYWRLSPNTTSFFGLALDLVFPLTKLNILYRPGRSAGEYNPFGNTSKVGFNSNGVLYEAEGRSFNYGLFGTFGFSYKLSNW